MHTSTYQWSCSACHTEVLVIRHHEAAPMVSAACPSCGLRILVSPTIRRLERAQLTAAAEVETA